MIFDEMFVDEIIKRKESEIIQLKKIRVIRERVLDELCYLESGGIDETEKTESSTKLKGILLEIDELLATY